MAEFRNEYTETGHGQSVYVIDKNRKSVTAATIAFITSVVEQTAVFLITVYEEEYPKTIQSKIRFEDNVEFNNKFDENQELIEIGQYGPYTPSEILFNIDQQAYITEFHNYLNGADKNAS